MYLSINASVLSSFPTVHSGSSDVLKDYLTENERVLKRNKFFYSIPGKT